MPLSTATDQAPSTDRELEAHIDAALAAGPLRGVELELAYRAIQLFFRPVIKHRQRVPPQPCLFVGNHSLFALDGLIIAPLLLRDLKRSIRPLGDRFLWSNKTLGRALIERGAVMGHPSVCTALMERGEDLLLFPGGAHEAVKPASALYELQWKERYGFIRLAAHHGYTIVPMGIVGPDEFYEHWIESDELPQTALWRLLEAWGVLPLKPRPDLLPPVPRGTLGSLLPRPQRCFIGFGEALDLSEFKGRTPTVRQQRKLRGQVAAQIEIQLAELLKIREQHRGEESLLRRILNL